MRNLLPKFLLAFSFLTPIAFGQYSYFLTDTTMAGPPSSSWTTSNSAGTDMLVNSSGGGEVRGVFVSGGGPFFQIYLAAYDCYGSCSEGGVSNFTSGYQLTFSPGGTGYLPPGGQVQLYSTWVNYSTGTAPTTLLSTQSIPNLVTGSDPRRLASRSGDGNRHYCLCQ